VQMMTDDAWMKATHGRSRMEGRADDDLPRARK
jgi:hypothetical protein